MAKIGMTFEQFAADCEQRAAQTTASAATIIREAKNSVRAARIHACGFRPRLALDSLIDALIQCGKANSRHADAHELRELATQARYLGIQCGREDMLEQDIDALRLRLKSETYN
jgi:hypothetical protein